MEYLHTMQPYNFKLVEEKWQKIWKTQKTAQTTTRTGGGQDQKKYYILNMFPYPSGAGLHVGHYIGYVASDILSRYFKHQGYHVMNPMGFDAFGLPAEQYAIQTGQHPSITTRHNVERYIKQFSQVGLDFNWDKSINTSDPSYYKWTQWIFLQLFDAWYNLDQQKAEPISTLIDLFASSGNKNVHAACDKDTPIFSAQEWGNFSTSTQQQTLLHYRLAYLKNSTVNWCEELSTVLANEEVKDGFSERGGHPVIRKQMKQWSLRIKPYAERLLNDLERLDWPLSTKEMQRNWIGRSEGVEITFKVQGLSKQNVTIFTTRPETIFGAYFVVLAPEHPLATQLALKQQDTGLLQYVTEVKNYSYQNRLHKKPTSGRVTSYCAIHPFTGSPLPIWVADYVLPHYGTAAIMGVPAHSTKDYIFAQFFELLSLPVIKNDASLEEGPDEGLHGTMINSRFLDGLSREDAFKRVIQELVKRRIGKRTINYKLHDPIFSRQRYWGEPFPIYYKEDGLPYPLEISKLPLRLPEVSSYLPNKAGTPPLSNAEHWETDKGYPLETATMPGWAGSSWYWFRYMDPENEQAFLDPKKASYWQAVDHYIGGAEHATGHLLYARFWTKVLYDLGYVNIQEPFTRLSHQGMIQNKSALVYKIKNKNRFISANLLDQYIDWVAVHIPTTFVENNELCIDELRAWRPEFTDAEFILKDGKYICGSKLEKMSKSKHNVVNPDAVIEQYGADTLRVYLMFLGPLSQSKPWDISGIEGSARFLHKVWKFVKKAQTNWLTPSSVSPIEVKEILHPTIKKVTESIERLSFNTAISQLMVCLNQLYNLARVDQITVAHFLLLLEPFAPHLAAELWEDIEKNSHIQDTPIPKWDPAYLATSTINYPIAINGKVRLSLSFPQNTSQAAVQDQVCSHSKVKKWISNCPIQRIVFVPNKMINIVLKQV